ncbi:hypothetical protein P171DRAFT_492228 [Karstenula rhodostoma CBS 690.94]|uniref:Uncharacterized protein n=1 Tax=Karstenula rhodostoma CBS 690.94 TaxID=1392251 RepID=A0A9P4P4W2_9PLEO|nr:hypothetical protein P171DRAFT_492228 [Karstenula rhodostoma CBS 690.94]
MSENGASSAPQITTIISDASSIKAQNRGPITTLFSPPSSCTATLTTQQPSNDRLFFGHYLDPYFDPLCLPLGTFKREELIKVTWDFYYYSPAICPDEWSTVATFQSEIPGGIPAMVFSLGTQTTAALGYEYGDIGHICQSSVTRNQRVPYVSPTNLGISWDRGLVSTSTMAAGTMAYGDGVQILWQSTDEALLSAAMKATTSASDTKKTSSLTGQSPSSTAQTSSSTSAATGGPAPRNRDGLSVGAKAGIGVGIAAVVLIATIVGWFLFLRRKRHGLELDAQTRSEVEGVGPVEKDSDREPRELPVPVAPAELHGHPVQNGTSTYVGAG